MPIWNGATWVCPTENCSFVNAIIRSKCRSCHTPRPEQHSPLAANILNKSPELIRERLTEVAPDLLEACLFIKSFLLNLENADRTFPGETEDPLLAMRRRVHKPLHDKLDYAIHKALGEPLPTLPEALSRSTMP